MESVPSHGGFIPPGSIHAGKSEEELKSTAQFLTKLADSLSVAEHADPQALAAIRAQAAMIDAQRGRPTLAPPEHMQAGIPVKPINADPGATLIALLILARALGDSARIEREVNMALNTLAVQFSRDIASGIVTEYGLQAESKNMAALSAGLQAGISTCQLVNSTRNMSKAEAHVAQEINTQKGEVKRLNDVVNPEQVSTELTTAKANVEKAKRVEAELDSAVIKHEDARVAFRKAGNDLDAAQAHADQHPNNQDAQHALTQAKTTFTNTKSAFDTAKTDLQTSVDTRDARAAAAAAEVDRTEQIFHRAAAAKQAATVNVTAGEKRALEHAEQKLGEMERGRGTSVIKHERYLNESDALKFEIIKKTVESVFSALDAKNILEQGTVKSEQEILQALKQIIDSLKQQAYSNMGGSQSQYDEIIRTVSTMSEALGRMMRG